MPCDGDGPRPTDACESFWFFFFLRRPGGGLGITIAWDESCDAEDEMYPPSCDKNGLPTNGRSGGCDCDCEDCDDSDAEAGCEGSEGSAVERSSGRRPGDARSLVALLVALEGFSEIGVSCPRGKG